MGALPDAQHGDHEYVEVTLDETSAAEAKYGVWMDKSQDNTLSLCQGFTITPPT
jgi:hypothetical protein